MRIPVVCAILLALRAVSHAGEVTITNQSEAAQFEQLYQRFLKEMRDAQSNAPPGTDLSFISNMDTPFFRDYFKRMMIVDPSFGLRWDEVPGPTLLGSNAMSAVNAFIATNGWNMQTNDWIFDINPGGDNQEKSKPIRGLPWAAIHEREFPAVTHDGILYVFFTGFHHDGDGVAYNPYTNHFGAGIDSFKPIGQHWYAWVFDHEFPHPKSQIYEGAKPVTNVAPASK